MKKNYKNSAPKIVDQPIILENLKVNNFPVMLVENYPDLIKISKEISNEKLIAFDTEFDRMKEKYGFNLDLIQILSGNKIYLIRVCKLPDIKPLKPIFENHKITKVIYAATEDIQLLKLHNIFPHNIVDLRIISKLTNYSAKSFKELVEQICQLDIEKTKQKSVWSKRLLNVDQLLYAAKDVAYSLDIYKKLISNNNITKVVPFIEEETEKVLLSTFTEFMPSLNARQKKIHPLSAAILLQLFFYRNELAKKANKPPIRIFTNLILEAITKDRIKFTCITNYPECPKFYKSNKALRELRNKEIIEILNRDYLISEQPNKIAKEVHSSYDKALLNEVLMSYRQHLDLEFGGHTSKYIMEGIQGFINQKNTKYADYRIKLFTKFLNSRSIVLSKINPINY
jgi:ribonuclease D